MHRRRFLRTSATCATALTLPFARLFAQDTSRDPSSRVSAAAEQAHAVIWRRFIDRHGMTGRLQVGTD